MRLVPETDVGVAMATGAFTLALFVVALAVIAFATPTDLGRRELLGFTVGFGLFISIYFVSMRADAVLTGDSYEDHE